MPLVYAMGNLDDLEILHAAHRHQCSLMAHGNLKEDSFKAVQQQAKELFHDMMKIVRPWEKIEKKTAVADLIEEFKQRFGDPNDPAVQAKYENQARIAMEQLTKESKEIEENDKKFAEFEQKLRENKGRRRRGNTK